MCKKNFTIKAIGERESDIHKILYKQTKILQLHRELFYYNENFFALLHKTLAENANKIKSDDGNEEICSVGS